MPQRSQIRKNRIEIAFFFGGLALLTAAMLWRAFLSIGDEDEYVYIINAFRWVKGEAMLVDDWNMSQLCSVFLYPFLLLYYHIAGSMTGVLLYSRLLFIAMQAGTAVLTFFSLRRYGPSWAAALFFFFSVPMFWFMVLYYNTITCVLIQLCAILLLSIRATPKGRKGKLLLGGVVFALSVLACPYLALLYFLYCIAVPVAAIVKKRHQNKMQSPLFHVQSWFFITLGIFFAAVLFLCFVFSRAGVAEIWNNLPMIFYDEEYYGGAAAGILRLPTTFYIFYAAIVNAIGYPLFAFGGALGVVVVLDRNRLARRPLYLTLAVLWYVISTVIVLLKNDLTYCVLIVYLFLYLALLCRQLTESATDRIFRYFCLFGGVAALLRGIESEMGFIACAAVLPVAVTGGVMTVAHALSETLAVARQRIGTQKNPARKINAEHPALAKTAAVLAVFAMTVHLGSQVYGLLNRRFFPENMTVGTETAEKLSVQLTSGPAKGVFSSAKTAANYNAMIDDLNGIRNNASGPVMTPNEGTGWIYLYLDNLPIGTYSAYIHDMHWVSFAKDKMSAYYSFHPEKYPEYIYVPYDTVRYIFSLENTTKQAEVFADICATYPCTAEEGMAGWILHVTPD